MSRLIFGLSMFHIASWLASNRQCSTNLIMDLPLEVNYIESLISVFIFEIQIQNVQKKSSNRIPIFDHNIFCTKLFGCLQ